jgi:hypothetical protein
MEGFLKASSAAGSFFGCTGRGCSRIRRSVVRPGKLYR